MMKRQTVKNLSIVGGGVLLGLAAIKTAPVIAAGYVLYPATTIAVGALAGMKAGEIAADVAFTATDFAKETVASFGKQWDARKSNARYLKEEAMANV